MIRVPADHVVTESRRFNRALGKESECIMLTFPHKRKLPLIVLPDRIREHIYKISNLIPSTKVTVVCFIKILHPLHQMS